MNQPVARAMMRGGVMPNTFQAPPAPVRIGAMIADDFAYGDIVGIEVCRGRNDIYSDCITTAIINAIIVTAWRKGVRVPIADQVAVDLFIKLGGMPANDGLDPGVAFTYWQQNAICGYKLKNVYAVALDDVQGIRATIKETGFLFCTFRLTIAQQTQTEWAPVAGSPPWANHAALATRFIGPDVGVDTWGERLLALYQFLSQQGINLWRLELVEA